MRIKASVSIILLLLLLICAAPVYADGIPALPNAFYGTLTLNNAPAPVGTQVSAAGTGVMTGVPQNPLTTTLAGQYGNGGLYLLVQGNILDGATITFYVNGVSTGQTAAWHSGNTTQLNLSVTIAPTPTPTTPPAGGGGGGGGAPALTTVLTSLFGIAGSFKIDSAGIVQTTVNATSADGNLAITISQGTKALDKNGNPLTTLTTNINTSPPPPPAGANIIALAYTFGPDGATFNPPITLTWTFNPNAFPAGVTKDDLVIAYYDATAGKWVALPVVSTTSNTITVSVSHFTTFAIIATPKPAGFSLSSLVVSPAQVAPGQNVNISISVANTGGTGGSYTVTLNINGAKEAEKSVTVAAGSSQTVSFSVAREKAGSYSVTIGGLSGSFTVTAPTTPPTTTAAPPPTTPAPPPTTPVPAPPPTTPAPAPILTALPGTDWPLIGGIIGGVIVVGLVIFFLVRTIIWRRQGG